MIPQLSHRRRLSSMKQRLLVSLLLAAVYAGSPPPTTSEEKMTSMFVHAFMILTMSSHRSSSSVASRSRFLSSSSSVFVAALSTTLWNPNDQCDALEGLEESKSRTEGNPRYLDREIQMQYGNNNPRTRGNLLVRRFTGDSTPYSFPVQPIRLVREWPENPPFTAQDFSRIDETPDGLFYTIPKFVYHM
jgi:hypothetical protein